MVEMYHGQRQWENRTAPGVHEAFSQIWGTRRLWCSHDRVSINPPCVDEEILNNPSREARGVHWDNGQLRLAKSPADVGPLGFGVQGVLYLVDTPAENGAFVCVPGFHRKVDDWLQALPEDAAPAEQDYLAMRGTSGKGLTRVGANAGDLVIWTTTLPHYAAVNIGDAPRVAQYITMSPAPQAQDDATRASRVDFWAERRAGNGNADNEAGVKTRSQPAATLESQVARQIAGIEPWPEAAEGSAAFSGLTAEWTMSVAAKL
jgi:hypothetical protein